MGPAEVSYFKSVNLVYKEILLNFNRLMLITVHRLIKFVFQLAFYRCLFMMHRTPSNY